MAITGWRVHFTRRDLAWPQQVTPLLKEFTMLFARLDQQLDTWGVPEGQPLLILVQAVLTLRLTCSN